MNQTQNELSAVSTMEVAATPSMSSTSLMLDGASMDKMMRLADFMASGKSTLPAHLRGSPGDCLAIVMQACQWNLNPFAVAQKTFFVNNTIGYEAQLVAAVINSSGAVKDRFHFEWFGDWAKIIGKFEIKKGDKGEYRVPGWKLADEDGLGIKVWATLKGETEPRVLELLLAQARTRNSTLWADDPKQQIAYLAQKRWSRLYASDVILGVYTPDEFDAPAPRDMGQAEVVRPQVSQELLDSAQAAAEKGVAAYQDFWKTTGKDNRKTLETEHERLRGVAINADKSRTVEVKTTPVTNAATGEMSVSFEEVIAKMDKATNEDALYVAYDWANAMEDLSRIPDVEAHFNARLASMRGE